MFTIEKDPVSHFIHGIWQQGSGHPIASTDPSTGQIIWQGFEATPLEVRLAFQSAWSAFIPWANKNLDERTYILKTYASLLKAHLARLAWLLSEENGKPLWEAQTEIQAMINKVDISVQAYRERTGTKIEDKENYHAIVNHKPHGVMVVLGPFNFPGHLPNGHIVPALLAGNTIIYKPSELTPRFGLIMAELFAKANIPPGVINVLQGSGKVGEMLVKEPKAGVLFTGSYKVGKRIHELVSGNVEKIVALEMGGNNPLVITECSALDAAISQTILSSFITAGQRCSCARRLIITPDISDTQFIKNLIEITQQLRLGSFRDQPEPFMGPLISEKAVDFIINHFEHWKKAGARILVGGTRHIKGKCFLMPTIIDMTHCESDEDEECFGPVLKLYQVKSFEDAINLANQTRYGLTAGIFTNNKMLYDEFRKRVFAGVINWNRHITGALSSSPFGGVGQSGNHRASAYYAADYSAYPVASIEQDQCSLVKGPVPGVTFN